MAPDEPDEPDGPGGRAQPEQPGAAGDAPGRSGAERRTVLLRLDPAVHAALARWAADDLHSVNAQIDLLLRRALREAGRLPDGIRPPRRQGRPRSTPDEPA